MSRSLLPRSEQLSTGLQSHLIRYVGAIFSSVTPQDLEATLDTLKQNTSSVSIHLDVTPLHSVDDILALLDTGVSKVFVTLQQLNELESIKDLDQERLILMITRSDKNEIIDAIGGKSVGIFAS